MLDWIRKGTEITTTGTKEKQAVDDCVETGRGEIETETCTRETQRVYWGQDIDENNDVDGTERTVGAWLGRLRQHVEATRPEST